MAAVLLTSRSQAPVVFVSKSEPVSLQGRRLIELSEGFIELELSLSGIGDGYFVSTIDIPREIAHTAGIQAPAGFCEEPLIEQPQQVDRSASALVNKWNSENVRFVGRFELQPGTRVLVIPAKHPELAAGSLDLTYEWHGTPTGVSIRSTKIALSPALR